MILPLCHAIARRSRIASSSWVKRSHETISPNPRMRGSWSAALISSFVVIACRSPRYSISSSHSPGGLPHHLKAYPIKSSTRVADPKIVDPSHDDGTNPLKDFGKLSMPGKFQNPSHAPEKLALFVLLRCA